MYNGRIIGSRDLRRPEPAVGWIAPKLALYLRMREFGINNSKLARKLGVRETVVRRMLDPDHATKTEKLQTCTLINGGF